MPLLGEGDDLWNAALFHGVRVLGQWSRRDYLATDGFYSPVYFGNEKEVVMLSFSFPRFQEEIASICMFAEDLRILNPAIL